MSETVIETGAGETKKVRQSPKRMWTRAMILIRRVHLYAGLYLLPWVILYGVTGAMFNHQGLFPEVSFRPVDSKVVESTKMAGFPSPDEFAQVVASAIEIADGTAKVTQISRATFTGSVMFEVNEGETRHVVHLDPSGKETYVATHEANPEAPKKLLTNVKNLTLENDPHEAAKGAVGEVLKAAGINATGSPKPLGWTKLNFLAEVDGEPVRVTYVMKDGHVDVIKYQGQDGFTPRHFFMRLHTTHGQSPTWTGRMMWSVIVDVMAIAMVVWGISGVMMWWQIKRTRLIGGIVIGLSVATALFLYLRVQDFYATTML